MDAQLQARAQQIQLLLLDVDGVLTDGRLYFSNSGEEFKAFCTLDGQGIKLLQSAGIKVGIITGRQSQLVGKRARDLGVELLVQGREDKWQALEEILQTQPVPLEQIAFMGDDWPDLTIMTRVGLTLADRKSTRLNSSHVAISYAVFCLEKRILGLMNIS